MKIIHCNIWGDIEVDGFAKAIIDTWAFQRLHYIRQTGILYKVFPTATTTRFEHSLGTYYLTRQFLKNIWRKQPEMFDTSTPYFLIPIAGLCRNLGYGPFSHVFDRFLTQSKVMLSIDSMEGSTDWQYHEHRACDILDRLFESCTFPYRVPPDMVLFVKALLCPDHFYHPAVTADATWYRTLIRNPTEIMDTSLLDYLYRDCHSLGIPCGFDIRRIMTNCRVIDNELCFCDRIQDDIWGVLYTRQRLYTMAYHHPKTLEFEAWVLVMFQHETFLDDFRKNVKSLLENHDIDMFLEWTDHFFLSAWFRSPMWRSLETRVFPCNHDKKTTNHEQEDPTEKNNRASVVKAYVNQNHHFEEIDQLRFYHRQRPAHSFFIKYQKPLLWSLE